MSKKVEDIYKKVTQIEHILLRPDTYIGSVEAMDQELWILEDPNTLRFSLEQVSFCQGLYKIFDEILVNAADNYQRDHSTDRIAVVIENDMISVENSGKGIPVQIHKEHNVYIPEMIFGHLLTSSNYDDTIQKVTGGRNGFGAKLTNIFSKYFMVETADKSKKFTMTWTDNMSKHSTPEITSNSGSQYTKVVFKPDLHKFKVENLQGIIPLLQKRVIDLAGILPVKVFLNGKKVQINNFKEYSALYSINKFAYNSSGHQHKWDVLVSSSEGQFQQVSFVNAINTIRGGTHVNHVVDQIVDGLITHIKRKNKEMKQLKPFQVRCFIKVFVNCLIVNPCFDSQTKETLTSKPSQFGSQFELSDSFLNDIIKKTDIVDNVLLQAKSKLNKQLSKQLSAKKQQRLLGIEKLEDANDAGTKYAEQCTLILTEGDSAKSLAMAGIEIVGRDKYGVFPLKGKLLNVRDATIQQIMKNSEIESLVKIMGLQFNKQYESTKSLRYGSIMIMTDQDHDGHHIKGLIINLIEKFWPSLLKMRGFLKQFVTPIIKVTKGKETHSFFSIGDYRKFIEDNPQSDYKVKYYKGLGTSTDQEAQQYFSNLTLHRKQFTYSDQTDSDYIDLAFSKTKADQRKDWLSEYTWDQIQDTLDYSKQTVRYRNFITDCLAMHSISDNVRSIPSLVDGLKPTQRKIIHTLLNHAKHEYKVSSLSGLVMSYAQYHHGEASLQQTIVGMAQNFTGSNNINQLLPLGQFGTRSMGGKDAAQARYIGTKLNPISQHIFNEHDLHILNYIDEEGVMVEPAWFTPILPMALVNGADGIGTGWATFIPTYNPRELCEQMKNRMRGQPFEELTPWVKGFTGQILAGINQYIIKGSFIQNKSTVYITELPPRKQIKEYQLFLQSKMEGDNPEILDLKEYHAGNKVCFEVKLHESVLSQDLEKFFKLSTTMSMNNLVLFNQNGTLKKYQNIIEIMEEFYAIRIQSYKKRREYLLSKYQNEYELISSKLKFIQGMVDNTVQLRGLKKLDMCKKLQSLGFKAISQMEKVKSTKIKHEVDVDNIEKQYDYLLSMPIWSFSNEKIEQLKSQTQQLQREIHQLTQETAESLWNEDINEFLTQLEKSEMEEVEDTIKRVEKNVEKLVKGGSKLLRSIIYKGKDDTQIECQDYSSDDEETSKNPTFLRKVVKEFAQFGILSQRNIPKQKVIIAEKKGNKQNIINDEQDVTGKQQFEESSSKPQAQPQAQPQINLSNSKRKQTKKLQKNEQQVQRMEQEEEFEQIQDEPKPALAISTEIPATKDVDIYTKYGLSDFLKYLVPATVLTTTAGPIEETGTQSLAERILNRQKQGTIDSYFTTIKETKLQNSDKKAKQNEANEVENYNIDNIELDIFDKPEQEVHKQAQPKNSKPKPKSKQQESSGKKCKKQTKGSDDDGSEYEAENRKNTMKRLSRNK